MAARRTGIAPTLDGERELAFELVNGARIAGCADNVSGANNGSCTRNAIGTNNLSCADNAVAADTAYVLGIDEVGRGCLAGPVMLGVAAVSARRLLGGLEPVEGVRDSKMLSPKRREGLLEPLCQWCDAWAVGSASNSEIDQWGIEHCLGLAALRAIAAVEKQLALAGQEEPSGIAGGDTAVSGAMQSAEESGMSQMVAALSDTALSDDPLSDDSLTDNPLSNNPLSNIALPDIALSDTAKDNTASSQTATANNARAQTAAAKNKTVRIKPTAEGTPGTLRFAAILDGPFDYITPAEETLDAPQLSSPLRVITRTKADATCALVSTASVIAKVTRDRFMVDLAQEHPQWAPYQWEQNKGYGTAAHRAAIKALGPTPYHRVSWHLT